MIEGTASQQRAVIVDYSPTVSDVPALLYLLSRTDIEVVAITIPATGESHCEHAVPNTLGILQNMKRDIPVACGTAVPDEDAEWPPDWRTAADELAGIFMPNDITAPSELDAVDLLIDTVAGAPGPVTLVTLGPLTNVAEAFARDPGLAEEIETIVIMGGAVSVPGNVPDTEAEWNLWIDPEAAATVLSSGANIALVPLDATDQVPVTDVFWQALRENHDSPAALMMYGLYSQAPFVTQGGFYFWDELAAAAILEPDLVEFDEAGVEMVLTGADRGRTTASPRGTTMQVATSVDHATFQNHLLSTLLGRTVTVVLALDAESEAYLTRLADTIESRDVDAVFTEAEARIAAGEPVGTTMASAFSVAFDAFAEHVATARTLTPPPRFASLHADLVTGFEAALASRDEIIARVATAETEEEVFNEELFAPLGAYFSACEALTDEAERFGFDRDVC